MDYFKENCVQIGKRKIQDTIKNTMISAKEYEESVKKTHFPEKTKVERHREIVNGLNDLYARKNADYGDSVHDTFMKYGLTSFLVRLEDKLNRARTLSKQSALVKDEKLEDTLLDMANYAILAVLELQDSNDE